MKSCAAVLALGALVLADSSALAQRRRGPQGGRHGWLGSLEQGKAQARQTGKPLMVVLRCEP